MNNKFPANEIKDVIKDGKKRDCDTSLDFKYFVLMYNNYYMNNYSVSVTFYNAAVDILKYLQCPLCKFHVTKFERHIAERVVNLKYHPA
jgi:hypothetical protein